MIIQKKIVDKAYSLPTSKTEKVTESLTIPGQAFNLRLAMEQYKKGSLVERVKGYYEKQGFETPDFNQMTRIERLEKLAEYRSTVKHIGAKLRDANNKAKKQHDEAVLKEKQKQQSQGGRSSDRNDQPDAK